MRRMPKAELDLARLPRHIAIIMDGNGRWAERHGVSHEEGHEAGAKSVRAVIEGCREIGIETLSLYAFSTENWKRSDREVNALFTLLSKYVHLEIENIHKEDIRVTIMGRREGLSDRVLQDLDHCMNLTRNNKAMTVNVALNYGGRGEIVDAAKAFAAGVIATGAEGGKTSASAVRSVVLLRSSPAKQGRPRKSSGTYSTAHAFQDSKSIQASFSFIQRLKW